MGRVSDRIGRRIPIVLGCVVSGLPLLAIPFVTAFPILLILALVYGLGFAMVTASTPALVSELVPRELVGTSMGFLDMLMDVGQTVGPIVTGFILASYLAYQGSFPALALVLLASSAVFLISGVAKQKLTAPRD
jgi:MFS family permease